MSRNGTKHEPDPELVREAFELVGHHDLWRANILHAGVELGVFDSVNDTPKPAETIADELETDPQHTYRFLRAMVHYGLLSEDADRQFTITVLGELFQRNHPQSVSHAVRFFWSQEHRSAWWQLPDVIREGETNRPGGTRT